MGRVVAFLPGQVDDRVATFSPLRGAGRRRGPDGRPRAHRTGRGRRRSRAPRRRRPPHASTVSGASSNASVRRGLSRGENEAEQIGARLDRGIDVVLACEAADLDERAGDQLGELRAGSRGAHQRRTDEDRVGARELSCGALARVAIADSAIRIRSRGARASRRSWAPRSSSKVERSRALMPITRRRARSPARLRPRREPRRVYPARSVSPRASAPHTSRRRGRAGSRARRRRQPRPQSAGCRL